MQCIMERAAADDVAPEREKTELMADLPVEIRMYLECEDQIPFSGTEERMYLITVDHIDISGMETMLLLFGKKEQAPFQKDADFNIIVAVGAAGSHFHKKDLQMLHRCVADDLKFFFSVPWIFLFSFTM